MSQLKLQQFIIVLFYYRSKDRYDIFYMDYGNTEIVPAIRICEVLPERVFDFPVVCYKCALAGIKPVSSKYVYDYL